MIRTERIKLSLTKNYHFFGENVAKVSPRTQGIDFCKRREQTNYFLHRKYYRYLIYTVI